MSCVQILFLPLFAFVGTSFREAESAIRAGEFTHALEIIEKVPVEEGSAEEKFATRLKVLALHQRGAEHFRLGRFADAIADFNREIKLDPKVEAHHWQRGIAYFYTEEFEKGAKQFELHRTVNPDDVENAAWHFLCVVRQQDSSVEKAQKKLIPVKGDPRVPMAEILEMFGGSATTQDVLDAVHAGDQNGQFYADLYVGLYLEAIGKKEEGLRHIRFAAENPSARDHTMGDVARAHLIAREKEKEPKKD